MRKINKEQGSQAGWVAQWAEPGKCFSESPFTRLSLAPPRARELTLNLHPLQTPAGLAPEQAWTCTCPARFCSACLNHHHPAPLHMLGACSWGLQNCGVPGCPPHLPMWASRSALHSHPTVGRTLLKSSFTYRSTKLDLPTEPLPRRTSLETQGWPGAGLGTGSPSM